MKQYNWNINKHVKEDRCREIMKNHGWRNKVMKLSFTGRQTAAMFTGDNRFKKRKNDFSILILIGCKKAEKSLIEAITEP